MSSTYVRYSDDLERPEPDEDAMVEAIVASMLRANRTVADKHRHGLRDAHAKSHGILRGELRVKAGLPPYLAQGLFATEASYPIIVRFSTAPGDIRSDQVNTQRGMAIKVIGAPGQRVVDDGGNTQDFLLVNHPTLPFGTVKKYLAFQEILEQLPPKSDADLQKLGKQARAISRVFGAIGREAPLPVQVGAAANNHILGETFHSMAAVRFGDFVAKISATPRSPQLKVLTGKPVDPKGGESVLRELVRRYFENNDAEFDLRAQLCTDISLMPVEDAGVTWEEGRSPHQTVATIFLPRQETYSDGRRIYADDVLSFDPWHAIEAHRPLGSIMRSRRKAYRSSSVFRHTMNRVTAAEPRSIDELPD